MFESCVDPYYSCVFSVCVGMNREGLKRVGFGVCVLRMREGGR